MKQPAADPFRLMWKWGVIVLLIGVAMCAIAIADYLFSGSIVATKLIWLAYLGFPIAFTGASASLFGLVAKLGDQSAQPPADETATPARH